jgi:MoxR-like ATPase
VSEPAFLSKELHPTAAAESSPAPGHDPRSGLHAVRAEVGKAVVGQDPVVTGLVIALLCRGHVLLEGVPGVAKTLLVRAMAASLSLDTKRVQFTPDLRPGDVTGSLVYDTKTSQFSFREGPVFTNLLLADEINRTPPKTQASLLEAMEERQVSVDGQSHKLPEPFVVAATQNPVEYEGTYPLPEAQLDRFFFKVLVPFPSTAELVEIANRTTSERVPQTRKIANGALIVAMQRLARSVPIASHVLGYAARLVSATHPEDKDAPAVTRQYVRYGASPRGMQALILAGKIMALLDGRFNVAFADLKLAALPALRHRVLLNFEAQAEGVAADDIIRQIVETIKTE